MPTIAAIDDAGRKRRLEWIAGSPDPFRPRSAAEERSTVLSLTAASATGSGVPEFRERCSPVLLAHDNADTVCEVLVTWLIPLRTTWGVV
jgi:hypothetical protein